MNETTRAEPHLQSSAVDPTKLAGWLLLAVFLIACSLLAWRTASGRALPGPPLWPETLVLVTAAAVTLLALSTRLPAQNVFLAATIVACIGGFMHALAVLTAIPFGPIIYTNAGPLLFNTVPWVIPVLWIVVVLSSRGAARLVLRPWRKSRTYGFRLIGLTGVLALVFDLGLEPFATRLNHYWLWSPTRFFVDWYGAPVTTFVGWMLTTVLILAFSTPALVKKRQHKVPLSYGPLIVWVAFNVLFTIGAASQQLWLGAGVSCVGTITLLVFAIRGARW